MAKQAVKKKATKKKATEKSKTKREAGTKAKRETVHDRTLRAGGMVPPDAKVDEAFAETLVARRYGGEVLGDRVVVRLGADRLGPAEDLAMEFLTLRPIGQSKPLARRARRALDFASWALIHHPENAGDALNLVKRMKAAARKAAAKPGHAWDAYVEMAAELNRSVRQFLPPFWDDVARTYKDVGSTTYAGRALGKALEAERVHALDVDADRRRDAVLEFALAGCLSGKALADYAKDLQTNRPPDEALATYRDLVVRRTLGGMPPTTSAGKELTRMIKAALPKNAKPADVEAELASVVGEMLAAPAMSRAPAKFWDSVDRVVDRLCRDSDDVAVRLIGLTNFDVNWRGESNVWSWLARLEQWDALRMLDVAPETWPAGIELPGGLAGWVSGLTTVRPVVPVAYFDLVTRAAGHLKAAGREVDIDRQNGWRGGEVDVDAIEALLDLGIPIRATPITKTPMSDLCFDGFRMAVPDHERRNSSLDHSLDHPVVGPRLAAALPAMFQNQGGRRRYYSSETGYVKRPASLAVEPHQRLSELWRTYVDGRIEGFGGGGLPDSKKHLATLTACVGKRTAAREEIADRVEAVDLAEVLARTLRSGVWAEYGWPALDALDDEHQFDQAKTKNGWVVRATFPYLTFCRGRHVYRLSSDGWEDFGEVPASAGPGEICGVLPTPSDMWVSVRNPNDYSYRSVWMREGSVQEMGSGGFVYNSHGHIVPVDDGVYFGGRVLHPGDRPSDQHYLWFSDGRTHWRVESNHGVPHEGAPLREVDGDSGRTVRPSVPAFFEDDGGGIDWSLSEYYPTPIEPSPLGTRDGQHGWRWSRRRDGRYDGVGIDGRRCGFDPPSTESMDETVGIVAMMDRPGGGYWRIGVDGSITDHDADVTLGNVHPYGERRYYNNQRIDDLPTPFYHYFELRCERSSELLRAVDVDHARGLLEVHAEAVRTGSRGSQGQREAVRDAVRRWLPDAPQRLVEGVVRVVRGVGGVDDDRVRAIKKWRGDSIGEEDDDDTGEDAVDIEQPVVDRGPQASLGSLRFAGPAGWGTPNLFTAALESSVVVGKTKPDTVAQIIRFLLTGRHDRDRDDTEKRITVGSASSDWISVIDDPAAGIAKWFWRSAMYWETPQDVANWKADWPSNDGHRAIRFLAESDLLDADGSMTLYVVEDPEALVTKRRDRRFADSQHSPVFEEDGCRYVALARSGYHYDRRSLAAFVAFAPGGETRPPKDTSVVDTIPVRRLWGTEQVKRCLAGLEAITVPPRVSRDRIDDAAGRLSVSPAQVAILSVADVRTVLYGQEKMAKPFREAYGLKVNELKPAVSALDGDPPPPDVWATPLREDPGGAYGDGFDRAFDRMIDLWALHRSSTVALRPEVVEVLNHVRTDWRAVDPATVTSLLTRPDIEPWSVSVGLVKTKGHFVREVIKATYRPEPPDGFFELFAGLFDALAAIDYHSPFGDPARRRIPDVIEAVRKLVDAPEVALPFGHAHTRTPGHEPNVDCSGDKEVYRTLIGGETAGEGMTIFRGERILAGVAPPACHLEFFTSAIREPADVEAVAAVAAHTFDYYGDGSSRIENARQVLRLRSAEADRMIEHNRGDDLPDGSIEQNPTVSVPDLVPVVAKEVDISEDAATLYLQLLALPDPTNKNVRAWNGWTAGRLKKAGEELAGTDRVVTAKRSRAGRELFLPGGWEPLKLPNLPIETWKLALYGYDSVEPFRGGAATRVLPRCVVPDLFRRAWQRIVDGDHPRYAETMSG